MHQHSEVVRKSLLTAMIEGRKEVERVEMREIGLAAGQEVGLHLHPCPVIGVVISGRIRFQIAGQAEKILHAGDAFFEPAHTHIAHFDATGEGPAKFVACYLLGRAESTLIEML